MEAAEAALSAVGLRFHHPKAHFLLGVALHRIGQDRKGHRGPLRSNIQNPYYPRPTGGWPISIGIALRTMSGRKYTGVGRRSS